MKDYNIFGAKPCRDPEGYLGDIKGYRIPGFRVCKGLRLKDEGLGLKIVASASCPLSQVLG